jgi:hypothetical protein
MKLWARVWSTVPVLAVSTLFAWAAFVTRGEANEAEKWPSTSAEVTVSEVGEPRFRSTSWRVDVRYAYVVGGVTYYGAGLTGVVVPHMSEADARAKVAQYPRGAKIAVYYDPRAPDRSVVEREPAKQSWMIYVAISLLVMLIGVANELRQRGKAIHDDE